MTPKELSDLVDRSAAQLGEHFDSVRIFCTKHDPEFTGARNTMGFTKGRGNWYAQFGSVRDWVTDQDEETRVVRRECEEGETDQADND